MSSRRGISLLAVLIFIITSPVASACGLLCPLYWLFGCQHIHPGYGGAAGGLYGNQPYASWKVIDDWLGYGYLRNQNGSLGHYPGNWYRNLHHGQGYAQPALAWQPQFNGMYPSPAAPVGPQPIYAPAWDPCCDPCGSMPPVAVMPQPQVYQMPQPQYYQPQPWMQTAPLMAGTVFGGDCCDSCQSTMTDSAGCGAPVMPEAAPAGDCGCSGGSSGTYTQPLPPVGMLPGMGMPQAWNSGYPTQVAANSWHPGRVWSPQQTWQQAPTWTAAAAARFQGNGINSAYSPGYSQNVPQPMPQYGMPQYAVPQYAGVQYSQPQFPQPQYVQPRMAQMPQPMPGMSDVYGDHEMPQNANGYIRPNAFGGQLPIRNASLSGPGNSALSRRYPASLR